MAIQTENFERGALPAMIAMVARATRALQRRRLVGRLGALDDRLLADMGITRADVVSSLAEPLFTDPTERLAQRARASRLARRAMARDVFEADAQMRGLRDAA